MSTVFQVASHSVRHQYPEFAGFTYLLSSWLCHSSASHSSNSYLYSRHPPKPFPSIVSESAKIIFDPQVTVPFTVFMFNTFLLPISQGHLLFLCDTLVLHCADNYRLLVSLEKAIGKKYSICWSLRGKYFIRWNPVWSLIDSNNVLQPSSFLFNMICFTFSMWKPGVIFDPISILYLPELY